MEHLERHIRPCTFDAYRLLFLWLLVYLLFAFTLAGRIPCDATSRERALECLRTLYSIATKTRTLTAQLATGTVAVYVDRGSRDADVCILVGATLSASVFQCNDGANVR